MLMMLIMIKSIIVKIHALYISFNIRCYNL